MRAEKRKRLEAKGWKVGSVKEFLDLSDQEAAYIELRLKLARGLKARRHARDTVSPRLRKSSDNVMYHVPPLEGRDCPVTRRRSPDGASIASGGKPPG
jgi:hypothetical protein